MSIEQQREFVKGLYPGKGWAHRVDQMSDDQVIAIYLRQQAKSKER